MRTPNVNLVGNSVSLQVRNRSDLCTRKEKDLKRDMHKEKNM